MHAPSHLILTVTLKGRYHNDNFMHEKNWPDHASGMRPSWDLNQSWTPKPLLFPEPYASFSFSFTCSFSSPLSVAKTGTGSLHLFLEPHSGSDLFTDAAPSSRGKRKGQLERERKANEHPCGGWGVSGSYGSVTCLAGLSRPGSPHLWKLVQKFQVAPEVTWGNILQHHQGSPSQQAAFDIRSKYRILKVVADLDHCSGIAVIDTCGKFPNWLSHRAVLEWGTERGGGWRMYFSYLFD